MSMPKVTRTTRENVEEASWEVILEKTVQNDWGAALIIIVFGILGATVFSILLYGADRFIEEAAQMIYEVRN